MLLAGTGSGLYEFSSGKGRALALEGESVSTVAAGAGRLLAGVRGKGVLESRDGGKSWRGVLESVTAKSLTVGPDGTAYVGAVPVAVYRSRAGSDGFEDLPAVLALPAFPTWNFPNRPHLGNIRSLACSPNEAGTVYAGVEVGGVIVSRDGGETWREFKEGLHPDVHEVGTGGPETLYAATGQGFHRSLDGGRSWESACEGLFTLYTVTLAASRQRPETVFTTATEGRPRYWRTRQGGACATIYRSKDAGATWQPAMGGLPETLVGAVEALAVDPSHGETVYAGTADGKVLVSRTLGDSWEMLAEGLPPVHAFAFT